MSELSGGIPEYGGGGELIDYIEVLLKHKGMIIAGTLACLLSAGIFSLARPRTYQAEALIVVSPAIASAKEAQQQRGTEETTAPLGTEIVVPGLAPQTYEVLAKSDELMYLLADTLIKSLEPELLKKLAGEDPTADLLGYSLSQKLKVELVKQTEKAKSPLLLFRYASAEERLPVVVVNLWAELFLKRHQGLSSNVTDEFYQRVLAQYEQAKENLERAEDELREVKAGYHSLNVLETEMNFKNAKLDEALKSYQQLQTDWEDKQRQLQHVDRLVQALEVEGGWIGYLPFEQVAALSSSADGAPSLRRDLIRLIESIHQLEQDSLAVWQRHERQEREFKAEMEARLMDFEQEYQIDRKRKQRAFLDSVLTQYRQEVAAIEQNLRNSQIQLQVRQQNLEKQPPVLVISKAVTDEALWNQVSKEGKIAPEVQKKLGQYGLQSEVLNPIYQDLAAQVNKLQIEIETYAQRKAYLENEIPRLQEELIEVRAHLDTLEVKETELLQAIAAGWQALERTWQREKEALVAALARKRQLFDQSRQYYLETKQNQEQLQRDLAALEAQVGFFRANFEKWGGDLRALSGEADSLELKRKRLEREIEVYRETFTRFARLQEEARIARQQAAGDIQMVSRATIPRAIPRGTAKNVGLAGVVGLMLSVFLAFMAEYVQKARVREQVA